MLAQAVKAMHGYTSISPCQPKNAELDMVQNEGLMLHAGL